MSNYDNTNSAVLFKNDKKGNEKAPDYKGKGNKDGKDFDIAGWIREGKSGEFISIKFSEPFKKQEKTERQEYTSVVNKPVQQSNTNEELPF